MKIINLVFLPILLSTYIVAMDISKDETLEGETMSKESKAFYELIFNQPRSTFNADRVKQIKKFIQKKNWPEKIEDINKALELLVLHNYFNYVPEESLKSLTDYIAKRGEISINRYPLLYYAIIMDRPASVIQILLNNKNIDVNKTIEPQNSTPLDAINEKLIRNIQKAFEIALKERRTIDETSLSKPLLSIKEQIQKRGGKISPTVRPFLDSEEEYQRNHERIKTWNRLAPLLGNVDK